MKKNVKFIVGITVIVSTIIYLGFTGANQDLSYYITVDELMAQETEMVDKKLKVAGQVVMGSIDRDANPMTFEAFKGDAIIQVEFDRSTPVPDTFKDHAEVVLDGTYSADGVFKAHAIQAKCASKYEVLLEEAPGDKK